ncbi:MAG: class I SAM-dependent methyltransferase [Candidatus Micrarchaeota archaeon]|nr:class I SAM-dependent methyltransferase [Candidatus Micrarchaeota archaeon]
MKSKIALRQVRAGFNIWKRGYRIMQRGNRKIINGVHGFVLEDISGLNVRSVLDIGCGSAKLLRRMSKMQNFRNAKLCGVDQDKKEIAKAKRLGPKKLRLILGKSEAFQVKGRFDLVISTNSFHEWGDKRAGISGALGRLNKGGQLIIYDTLPTDTALLRAHYKGFHGVFKRSGPLVRAAFTRRRL